MNTVAKGNAFEKRVFEAVKRELEGERLGLSPSTAKVFRKKGYYSAARGTDIVVDVAIEVWPPDAKNWAVLWVCECKDYSGSIPVNDVEEFRAKLEQIAGVNVKGVLAITGALQDGALTYARSKGIGVVRILPDNQVIWMMHFKTSAMLTARKQLSSSDFHSALTRPSFVGRNRDFYAAKDRFIFGDWYSLLRHDLQACN